MGILIGIAAMVGVLGLSESSRSDLLAQLERLGTNLLTVEAGGGIWAGAGTLPAESATMVARIGPVESTTTISTVVVNVYRNDLAHKGQTGGISVHAVDATPLDSLAGNVADRRWLPPGRTPPSCSAPSPPSGSASTRLAERSRCGWTANGSRWPGSSSIRTGPDLDRAALVGLNAAAEYLGYVNPPTRLLVRVDPDRIDQVTTVLLATANPEFPEEVEVARPTDALEAQEAADDTLTAPFLGLGAVALLVGGVGIANVMVIAVLERRGEIGLRRVLGPLPDRGAAHHLSAGAAPLRPPPAATRTGPRSGAYRARRRGSPRRRARRRWCG